jgi:hypothetical protein
VQFECLCSYGRASLDWSVTAPPAGNGSRRLATPSAPHL